MINSCTRIGVLGVCLLAATWSLAQEPPARRGRGTLPTYYKRLGLSDEQTQQIYAVRAKYQAQMDDLRQQIMKLRQKERQETEKVLTDAQKARLREIMAERAPREGGSESTKPPTNK